MGTLSQLDVLLVTMTSVYYNIHSFKNNLQNKIHQPDYKPFCLKKF